MKQISRPAGTVAILAVTILAGTLYAKRKASSEADGATSHLFQLLDSGYKGKLDDFYLLADLYKDAQNPDQQYRHVLRLSYDKGRVFGKLTFYVRSVGKLEPQQLQAYTVKQIFEFGETDAEKFVKTSGGEFGAPGDVYLKASQDGVLVSAPITDDVRKEYNTLIGQYVTPALEKNSPGTEPTGL